MSTTHTRESVRMNTHSGGVRDPGARSRPMVTARLSGIMAPPDSYRKQKPVKRQPGNASLQAGRGIGRY
jgi:hypothetical protein